MNSIVTPASFAHEGVRISALVPESWSVTEVAGNHVRFLAPAHPDHEEHRATFSISLGEPPDGFSPDGFQNFCDTALAKLKDTLPGFELRKVEYFTLSSFVDIHAVWFNCSNESGLAFVQLQALGLLNRYNLYLINAAALLPLADMYLPDFDFVLRSLRVLPSR